MRGRRAGRMGRKTGNKGDHDERIKVNVIRKNWEIVDRALVFFILIKRTSRKEGEEVNNMFVDKIM